MSDTTFTRLLLRARAEYLEMPGLRLTTRQAARLWSLDREVCNAILQQLTASGFLGQTPDGAFLLRAPR
jgi:hypothetical protein